MKTIDRYIGKQVVSSTVFAVAVLTLVLVLGNIMQKLMGQLVRSEIPLWAIVKSVLYLLPFSLVFTLPWGFLTSILLVFGRLSADNELVALRMAGMSVRRICLPVFVVAGLLSGLCLWINVEVAPRAEAAIKKTIFEAALANPLSLFAADQVTELPGYRIYVEEKEGNELRQFRMVRFDDKRSDLFVTAEKVVVTPSGDRSELEMRMFNAHLQFGVAPDEGERFDPTDKEVLIMGDTPQRISLEKLIESSTKRRASQLPTSELARLADDPAEDVEVRSGFRVEMHKRFSLSAACLTFALIGVPLGITAQRRETSIGFVLSLLVAVVYFLFIIVADWFKREPEFFPHLMMWGPNVVFLGLGGWLFARMNRR